MPVSSNSSNSSGVFPVFDQDEMDLLHELLTNPTRLTTAHSTEENAPELGSPIPDYNLEWLSGRLFSVDHLNIILQDQGLLERFARFLEIYRPHCASQLFRCLKAQKAMAAIDYRNSVQEQPDDSPFPAPMRATIVDEGLEIEISKAMEELISDALPTFITEQLVHIVTECLVKEITGTITPLMREMAQGLGEVYCITDARVRDNPIIYASEEFLRSTQYDLEYVVGRNCRFLQGSKTSPITVARLMDALARGTEVCETILNYRKDGTPFMNLLTVQPLLDHKGTVWYYIGFLIDVSNLIEGGRGLDSFNRLLQDDQNEKRRSSFVYGNDQLRPLTDLANMLDSDEVHTLKQRLSKDDRKSKTALKRWSVRVFPDRDESALFDGWILEPKVPEPLPQVYQNYLLIRPAPSFRVIFTSAALRIPGLFRCSFLDRIGGPPDVQQKIKKALTKGVGITTKISWLTQGATSQNRGSQEGKQRWIHCTPMYGVDGKIGVWMIVMVENESISGSINAYRRYEARQEVSLAKTKREECGQMYAHYLRREVANNSTNGSSTCSKPMRKAAHRDTWWKDLSVKLFGVPEIYSCIGAE